MLTKNCLTCSFCSKAFRGDDDKEKTLKLNDQERRQIQNHNFEFIDKNTRIYLTCFRNQWCEATNVMDKEMLRKSLKSRKCKNYFSFKKSKTLLLSAIIELQKNDYEKFKYWFNFWVTNILVIIGIIVTIIYH